MFRHSDKAETRIRRCRSHIGVHLFPEDRSTETSRWGLGRFRHCDTVDRHIRQLLSHIACPGSHGHIHNGTRRSRWYTWRHSGMALMRIRWSVFHSNCHHIQPGSCTRVSLQRSDIFHHSYMWNLHYNSQKSIAAVKKPQVLVTDLYIIKICY